MTLRFVFLLGLSALMGHAQAADCPSLLNREIPRLQDEKPQNLCQYKGLEALYSRYQQRGLVVLGFPSNDFSQEPGDSKTIADFCENTYGVKFPMFIKTRVADAAGAEKSPLFAELKQATGEAPKWNFHKYVIARDGKTVQSFGTMTSPDSASFVKNIEKLLDAK